MPCSTPGCLPRPPSRGGTPAALIAVHHAIVATSTPRTALNWLRNGAGAAVLADLAAGTTPISHAALDAHPRRRGADYLRHVLVAAEVLPARDEGQARLDTWVATTLLTNVQHAAPPTVTGLGDLAGPATGAPPSGAQPHRPDPNRLPPHPTARRRPVPGLARSTRRHAGPLPPRRRRQLARRRSHRRPVREFLGWASEHHHSPTLIVATLGGTTGTATDPDQRWALLARLLHDDTLELTDRVAGTLLLCYGQQVSRIAAMKTQQVHRQDDLVSLCFGVHHITVAEPLAGLLTELIDVGRSHRGVGSPATTPWLFPGHLPGRPITASRLGERLRLLGVRALPGRRATLLQVAAQVPAAVLADLLHLTPGTASRWTRDAGGDWSRYAAELASERDHQR